MIKQTFKPYNLKDVERNSSKALFSVVSTFAGGGGSSTGYKNAGGKIDREAIPHYSIDGGLVGLARDPDNYVVEIVQFKAD